MEKASAAGRLTEAVLAVGLAAAAIVPFLPALAGRFVMDDHVEIDQNPLITGSWDWRKALLSDVYAGRGSSTSGLYRPAATVAYRLIALPAGGSPLPFHIVNLLLHAGAVLAGYAALRSAGSASGVAGAASLLFAVHPVQVDIVAPGSGLKDLLAAAAGLASLLAWMKHRRPESPSPAWLAVCCGFLLVAVLSKESVAALPLLFLAADALGLPVVEKQNKIARDVLPEPAAAEAWLRNWKKFRRIAPSWLAVAAVMVFAGFTRILATGGLYHASPIPPVDNPLVEQSPFLARLSALRVFVRSLTLLLWPARFSHDYSADSIPLARSRLEPAVVIGAVLLAALLLAVPLLVRAREWVAAFGLAAFLAFWLVVSNLVVLFGSIMAPRLLALPAWGLCVAVAAIGALVQKRSGAAGRRGVSVLLLVAALACAARTWARCADWRDDEALFRSALRVVPRNAKMLSNLAAIRASQGRLDEAEELNRRAIDVRPERDQPYLLLASVLQKRGRSEKALDILRRGSRGRPRTRAAHRDGADAGGKQQTCRGPRADRAGSGGDEPAAARRGGRAVAEREDPQAGRAGR